MKVLRVKSVNGDTSFQNETVQISGYKKYILVSAINYDTGYSFIKYCDSYRQKIEEKNKNVQVIIIDMLGGNITTYLKGKKIKEVKYDVISPKNYDGKVFAYDLGKKNYITKKVIYNLICDIGQKEPNTLEDISIFSHSYWGGAILANSYETDSFDLDMRINDIKNKTFDFTNFKKAFTDTGIFKIWGCNMDRILNNLIKQIIRKTNYKKDGTTPDNSIFTIIDSSFGGYKISDYVPTDLRSKLEQNKFEMTMSQIKKFLAGEYYNNFAGCLSYYVDVSVLSALPSTYASFSNPNYFRISDDTKQNINIFEKYLQIEIGDLNYGLYNKETILRLSKV